MGATKITITLPDDQVRQVRALVAKGQSASTSAFVRHAVSVALADVAVWGRMLEEALDQTGGPLTAEEHAWANSILTPNRAALDPDKP